MKNILIILCLIITVNNASGQWQWSRHIFSTWDDYPTTMCKDSNGYIYIGGRFESTLYFQSDTLQCNGNSDFFISKYDDQGNEIWAKRFGGNDQNTCYEGITTLCFDNQNEVLYAYSYFCGSPVFGSDTLHSFGDRDIAILKLDANGNVLDAIHIFSVGPDAGNGCAVDQDGNIYVCGETMSPATFDTITLPRGGFFAKYESSGTCIWAKNICTLNDIGDNSQFVAQHIICSGNSIYLTGLSTDDTLQIDTISFSSTNEFGGILTKFDSDGDIQWGKIFGYPHATSFSMDMDAASNLYITGLFSGDSSYFDTTLLTNNNQWDLYYARIDTNGIFDWVKQLHITAGFGEAHSTIKVNSNGTFYLAGNFSGDAVFGNDTITAFNDVDMFLAYYNSNGECLAADHFGKAYSAYQTTVITDNNGIPIILGYFDSQLTLGNDTLNSQGLYDTFLAKHNALTGIEEGHRSTNKLMIYANPNKGLCSVTIPDDFKHDKNLILSIYDNSAKIIQQGRINIQGENIHINLEAEAKGIYNVTLNNGKKSYCGKIIFE